MSPHNLLSVLSKCEQTSFFSLDNATILGEEKHWILTNFARLEINILWHEI